MGLLDEVVGIEVERSTERRYRPREDRAELIYPPASTAS
jgi:hypothetical protein